MRSFVITALCLTLIHTSYARVADRVKKNAEAVPRPRKLAAARNWIRQLFPRVDEGTCLEDKFYDYARSDLGFCQLFMEYPNVTSTIDFTPTRLTRLSTPYCKPS